MAPNRQARVAATLMWTALPFGVIVTGFNIAGFVQTRANLPRADFADFGSHRIFSIAGFLAVAALVFGLLGGAVRRGRWRRPAGLLLLIGAVPVTFCVGLYLAFFNNPVTGFQGPGNIQPLVMHAAKPAWYLP